MVGCYNFVQVRPWSLTIWTHGMSLLICLHWSIRGLGAPEKWEEAYWAYWNNAEDNGRHRKTSSGLLGVDRGKSLGRGWRTWCRLWMWAALWWSFQVTACCIKTGKTLLPLKWTCTAFDTTGVSGCGTFPISASVWYEGFLFALVGVVLWAVGASAGSLVLKGWVSCSSRTQDPDDSWAFEYWC